MKKLLPIGIQTFSKLRETNCVYVDKTELIYKLTQGGGNTYFLSRPRRFGKSMTLSTLKSIYEGEKHLFEGLWIEDKWDWTRRNPVLHLSFNDLDYKDTPLSTVISTRLAKEAKAQDIVLESTTYGAQFEELIQKLAKSKGKVVILIDEYDKPIIDYLEEPNHEKAREHRAILRQFYACLKSNDYNIELFLMTGVSKFSQTGIFSHLNHLRDITLDENFVTLVGYTHEELVENFDEYIEKAAKRIQYSKEELLQDIKTWYNGYSWDAVTSVYNPYSVLLFFQKCIFEPHWSHTGSPKFLIDIIKQERDYDFNQLKIKSSIVESYDIENLNIRTLMFQTGYLTIKEIDRRKGTYLLDYPNREVEEAMSNQILAMMTNNLQVGTPLINIQEALAENNIEKVVTLFNSMLKSVPSMLLDDKTEHFYHCLVHIWFRYIGFEVESEVHTSDGRMDAVSKTDTHIYIFEFKINKSAELAFQQILDKKYADKYRMENKTILGLGINFDTERRCIEDWKMEKL
jgi:Predicted AAA-ATPase/PD-(D/E)XK nuclease superfamily